ncbi:MAG: hypothetical protein WCD62_19095, partial [Pseudolabrys sp.]
GSAMKTARLKLVDRTDMRPVTSTGRSANKTYRTREHLTEAEIPDSFTMCQSVETNMSLIWQT